MKVEIISVLKFSVWNDPKKAVFGIARDKSDVLYFQFMHLDHSDYF